MNILVSGATGVLGTAITSILLKQGRAVRVMTRHPARAATFEQSGAEVVVADLRDRNSLARACRGMTHVITTANAFVGRGADSVASVDRQGNRNLIDAASNAGVRQFVFTSALLKPSFAALDYFSAKLETEDYLRRSALTYTILHPTAFMETWAVIVGEPLVRSGRALIFGAGTTPFNLIAVENVAEVASMTLDREDALNATVDIVGPQNITFLQIVETFERVTGRKARRTHVPVRVMRVMAAVLRPFNRVLARQMQLGALSATVPQEFDPAPMLARFPVRLLTLEEWARKRAREGAWTHANAESSRA